MCQPAHTKVTEPSITVLPEGRRSQAGLTLIEVVITLAVLGVLLGIAIPNLRPPALRLATNSVQAFLQQARFDAIRLNGPVGVSLVEGQLVTTEGACSGTPVRTLSMADYPQVTVSGEAFRWSQTGQPITCAGAGNPISLNGLTYTLSDGRGSTTVRVGGGGAVSVE